MESISAGRSWRLGRLGRHQVKDPVLTRNNRNLEGCLCFALYRS